MLFSVRVLVGLPALALTISQAVALTVTAKAGEPRRLWSTWNCQTSVLSYGSGSATHGTVQIRTSTQHRCGNPKQPVLEYWYTPKTGFKGTDEVFLYYGGWSDRVSVSVQ